MRRNDYTNSYRNWHMETNESAREYERRQYEKEQERREEYRRELDAEKRERR